MPYHQNSQAPADSKTRKLQQLQALQDLSGQPSGFQQAQLSQQDHQNRVAAAMQLMGLQQQQQNEQAMQAFRQSQLAQEGTQITNQQQHYADENTQAANALEVQRQAGLNELRYQVVHERLAPGVTDAVFNQAAGLLPEELQSDLHTMRSNQIQQQIPGMEARINEYYHTPSVAKDPKILGPLLSTLRAPQPDVFDSVDWAKLNTGFPVPGQQGPSGPGVLDNRQGGILSPVGQAFKTWAADAFPNADQRAKNRAANDADPTNPFNLFFGKKTQPQS